MKKDNANKLSAHVKKLKQSLAYAVFFMAKRGQIPLESTRGEKKNESKAMLIELINTYNELQLDIEKEIKVGKKSTKKGKGKNEQKGREEKGKKERCFLQFVARSLEIEWDANAFYGQNGDDDDEMIDLATIFLVMAVIICFMEIEHRARMNYMRGARPNRLPNPLPNRLPNPLPNRLPNPLPNRLPNRLPNPLPNRLPNPLPNRLPNRLPNPLPNRLPNPLPNRLPNPLPNRLPNPLPNRLPNPLPNRLPNPLPNRLPNRLPNPLPNRSQSAIDIFNALDQKPYVANDEEGNSCPICIAEIKPGTMVKPLPCNHIFHNECISSWLSQHITCPSCRYTAIAVFNALDQKPHVANDEEGNFCPICIAEIKPGTMVKPLPCNHIFHNECISSWLSQHITCPSCREALSMTNAVRVSSNGQANCATNGNGSGSAQGTAAVAANPQEVVIDMPSDGIVGTVTDGAETTRHNNGTTNGPN
ncbi:hypothetical protein niasHS_016143 [Heterodera schachtii]|uniref:RING-type domain-containing protein n=1 Tax=Heterodera schachtii TaxID=97005 RepID=A0ABD2HZ38_HETSC